jgi:hypothetical protein
VIAVDRRRGSDTLQFTHLNVFAMRKKYLAKLDDITEIDGQGLRFFANIKTGDKVWYVNKSREEDLAFWKLLHY